MRPVRLDDVRAALALDGFDARESQRRMAPQPRTLRRPENRPGQPHQASVMLLLFPAADGLAFPLIRRTEHPEDVHSGQIGLPGGSRIPGETPLDNALREAGEELGLSPQTAAQIEIVGQLTPLYIPPSDFDVAPFVGALPGRPRWQRQESEVVEVLECPVTWLFDDAHKAVEDWDFGGYRLRVPWYDVRGHRVWGATAIILSELEQRLRRVVPVGHA